MNGPYIYPDRWKVILIYSFHSDFLACSSFKCQFDLTANTSVVRERTILSVQLSNTMQN